MTIAKTQPKISVSALAYDERGSGATVVQLHGLTSSRRRDEALGFDLTSRCAGMRVVRYDARGHGQSPGGMASELYTWTQLSQDFLDLVDEVCPGEAVHAVGQSMGAATLILAALARPDRFASLSLVIPPTAWESRVSQRQNYLDSARFIEQNGRAAFTETTRQAHLPSAVNPNLPFTAPDVSEALLPSVFRGAAASDLPAPLAVGKIEIPTQVFAWTEDESHPESVAAAIAETTGSPLYLAQSPLEVEQWPKMIADFISLRAG